jgi:uncharacterized protein YgfB (UPF0149 family)
VTTSFAHPAFDYERLRAALDGAGAVIGLAELHGGLCAALCAGGARAAERWLADCLEDQDLDTVPAEVASLCDEIVRASWQMLIDDALSFEPLLPSGDVPLDERVHELALWCHGFLAGMGSTAPDIGRSAGDAELREIFADLAEISRAGVGDEEAAGGEEADFSLAEIHEHVRVSVQLVFEHLAPYRAAADRDVH